MISRRRLLTGFVLAWAPLGAAVAQEYKAGKVWRIGYLMEGPNFRLHPELPSNRFVESVRNLGYVEGQNIGIEYRWAEGR